MATLLKEARHPLDDMEIIKKLFEGHWGEAPTGSTPSPSPGWPAPDALVSLGASPTHHREYPHCIQMRAAVSVVRVSDRGSYKGP